VCVCGVIRTRWSWTWFIEHISYFYFSHNNIQINMSIVCIGCHAKLGVAGVKSCQGRWCIPRTIAGWRLVRVHRQSHNIRTGGLGKQQQRWRRRVRPAGHGHAGPRHVRRDIEGVVRQRAQLLVAPAVVPGLAVIS